MALICIERLDTIWYENGFEKSASTPRRRAVLSLDVGTVTIWYENGIEKSGSTPRRRAVLSQTDRLSAWRGVEVVFCCGASLGVTLSGLCSVVLRWMLRFCHVILHCIALKSYAS